MYICVWLKLQSEVVNEWGPRLEKTNPIQTTPHLQHGLLRPHRNFLLGFSFPDTIWTRYDMWYSLDLFVEFTGIVIKGMTQGITSYLSIGTCLIEMLNLATPTKQDLGISCGCFQNFRRTTPSFLYGSSSLPPPPGALIWDITTIVELKLVL